MKSYLRPVLLAALAISIAFGTLVSTAQDRGRRFDPEQMRERMMQMMKERLGASDAEWQVIGPLYTKVTELQREARMGGGIGRGFFGGFGRGPGGDDDNDRGRRGRGDPPGFERDVNPEVEALQDVLESANASSSEIKEKLDAYRDARKKKEAALQDARDKLRKVLTVRQEAMLVLMGTLD